MIDYEDLREILSEIFYNPEDFKKFIETVETGIPQYIRINPLKIKREKLLKILKEKGFKIKGNEWVDDALEVEEGPFEISKTVEHFLGFFYIQSLSSMLPVKFLEIDSTHKILDLCSAPGSKTTQIGIMLGNSGAILANDINIERLRALSHNIDRMGLLNVMIMRMKGEKIGDLFFEEFDRVILDPPCSSLGTISKNKGILRWWHPREIDKFYRIQKELFKSAIKALKPGGKMVYSTCTLSIKENEFLVSEMLKKYPLEILEIKDFRIPHRKGFEKFRDIYLPPEVKRTMRIYPQDINSEGFYIAILYKKDKLKREKRFYSKDEKRILDCDGQEVKEIFSFLEGEFGLERKYFENFLFYIKKDETWILSKELNSIKSPFDLRRGLRFVRKYKKGYKLTTNFVQVFGKFVKDRKIELEDFESAKNFLEGKDIKFPASFRGQVVVFYKDYVLGVGTLEKDMLKSQVPKSRRIFEIEG